MCNGCWRRRWIVLSVLLIGLIPAAAPRTLAAACEEHARIQEDHPTDSLPSLAEAAATRRVLDMVQRLGGTVRRDPDLPGEPITGITILDPGLGDADLAATPGLDVTCVAFTAPTHPLRMTAFST